MRCNCKEIEILEYFRQPEVTKYWSSFQKVLSDCKQNSYITPSCSTYRVIECKRFPKQHRRNSDFMLVTNCFIRGNIDKSEKHIEFLFEQF